MASRRDQKERARAERIAKEQAEAAKAAKTRRLRILCGVLLGAVVVVAVAIAISAGSGGTNSKTAAAATVGSPSAACTAARTTAACSHVNTLLAGIPERGNTLGNPNSKVTITEFGDLECSVCDEFALDPGVSASNGAPGTGYEDQIITRYVRTGKAKLVYRSLETATGFGGSPAIWAQQQSAVNAAGLQNKAWYYIELFYSEQQPEGTPYNSTFLAGVAKQIEGLTYSAWLASLKNSALGKAIAADGRYAQGHGFNSTPTITIQGPHGEGKPIVGLPSSFDAISSEINSVS